MSPDDQVTLGELYRLCQRMSEQLDAELEARHDLETRVGILEDRENRAAKMGGIWGSIGGLVGGFFAGIMGGRAS